MHNLSNHYSFISIGIIMLSVVLALSRVGSPPIFSVATAAEEVPEIAHVALKTLNEQTQRGDTQLRPAQPQMMNEDGDFWGGWWIVMPIMMVIFWGGVITSVVRMGGSSREIERAAIVRVTPPRSAGQRAR